MFTRIYRRLRVHHWLAAMWICLPAFGQTNPPPGNVGASLRAALMQKMLW